MFWALAIIYGFIFTLAAWAWNLESKNQKLASLERQRYLTARYRLGRLGDENHQQKLLEAKNPEPAILKSKPVGQRHNWP